MDYICVHCEMSIEFVGQRFNSLNGAFIDVWEHSDFNPNCGEPELNTTNIDIDELAKL